MGAFLLAIACGSVHSQTTHEEALEEWEPNGILDQIVDIDLTDIPLSEALDDLSDELAINILLDAAVLRDDGLSPEEPVSLQAMGITLRSALQMLIEPLELVAFEDEGLVRVTTTRGQEQYLRTIIYTVGPLIESVEVEDGEEYVIHDFGVIETALSRCVAPLTWIEAGGPGLMKELSRTKNGMLLVRHVPLVHRDMADVISGMYRAADILQDQTEEPPEAEPTEITPEPVEKAPQTGYGPAWRKPTPAEVALLEKLERPVSIDCTNLSFAEVLALIEEQAELGVRIHESVEDTIGKSAECGGGISCRYAETSAATVLDAICRTSGLEVRISSELLFLVDPKEREEPMLPAIYPIEDLTHQVIYYQTYYDYDTLIEILQTSVAPRSWDDTMIGSAVLEPIYADDLRALAILQHPSTHVRIEGLLEALRDSTHLETYDPKEEDGFGAGAQAVRDALSQDVSFRFQETPLEEALREIADQANVNLLIDRRALLAASIDPDLLVRARCSDLPLHIAIGLLLKKYDLGWTIYNESLWITSRRAAERSLRLRIYPMSNLSVRASSLSDMILEGVAPESWRDQGGQGLLFYYSYSPRPLLVIRQTEEIHHEIERLLRQLEAED